MAGNSRIRINGNRLVIPHVIRYNYLPRNGMMLYIWHRKMETNFIAILDGYDEYVLEEKFLSWEPKQDGVCCHRLFCLNIETTTIENDKIILTKRAREHLGTEDIELRIRKGLLEVYPKSNYNTPQE